MCCSVRAYEEAVVINVIATAINVSEECDVLLLAIIFHIEEVRWYYVEVCGVEIDQVFEFLRANSKVSQLLSAISSMCLIISS